MLSKKHIFCVVGISSAAIRLVFYALFAGTMFRYYHMVNGLDMQTLLRFSEWGSATQVVPPFFTLHRITLFLLWKLNGGVHPIDLIFLIQTAVGIAGALAVTDVTLMLSGKRKAALVAGIISALYLPFLVYEFSILQETFTVNTLLFAIWALLKARKKRFNILPTVGAGLLWGFALTGRPVAIPVALAAFAGVVLYCRKKHFLKKSIPFFAAVVLVSGCATAFNAYFKSGKGPFYNVLPYTVQYNTESSPAAQQSKLKKLTVTAGKMLSRTPLLLSVRELPENQNIYFWREKMPESRLLIGPEILMTLTIFSLLVMLSSGKWKKPETLILWTLLLSPVLCGREAIGRYRLMLCPYFIIIAVLGISMLPEIRNVVKRRTIIFVAASIAIIFAAIELNRNRGLRISDFHSWAIATEAAYGSSDVTIEAYYECWQRSIMRSDTAFRAIQGAAMRGANYEIAAHVIRQAELAGAVNPSLIAYYTGLIYVGKQDPEGVARAFAKINPRELPPDLLPFFEQVLNDTRKILHQRENQRLNKTP